MYSLTLQGNKAMQFKPHYFKFKGKTYKSVKDTEDTVCSIDCDLSHECDRCDIHFTSCLDLEIHYIEVKNV